MPLPGKVISIAPPELQRHFGTIKEGLNRRGIEVRHYNNLSQGETIGPAHVVVVWPGFPCTAEFLDRCDELRAIVCPFAGAEGIDLDAASDRIVLAANGAIGESHDSMAEATILMLLAALYDLNGAELQFRTGANVQRRTPTLLCGKTVGLVGFGSIGHAIARRLVTWNVRILSCTRSANTRIWPDQVERVDLDTLLHASDVVCLVASLNEQSRRMIGWRELNMLKRNAVLVNTARGGLIDEQALIAAANVRSDIRFALDCYEIEPLAADSDLRMIPGAILTGHNIGHTGELMAAIPEHAVRGGAGF